MQEKVPTKSCVTINMIYRNAPKAIDWLCDVYGFEKHAIYPGENNTILHSELTLGGGMIMVSSFQDSDYNRRFMRHPDEIGGAETHSVNLIVKDADAIYNRVKAEGGEVLLDIEDKHYGGRGFTCRDFEGHIWNIGTYDPWQPK